MKTKNIIVPEDKKSSVKEKKSWNKPRILSGKEFGFMGFGLGNVSSYSDDPYNDFGS